MPLGYTPLFPLLIGLAVGTVAASPALAQECAPAEAEATLSGAGVRANLFNNGALFWKRGADGSVYEVPKGSGSHAVFTTVLWVAGQADGSDRFAGSDFGPYEFWPGPLGPGGAAPTPAFCAAYDRIWRVTLEDIARYNATGEAAPDLVEWPYEVGAPVVDGDGLAGNYDLAAGDRPAIVGDETAWWIMNDRGGSHDWGELSPVGLEARVTAFTVSEAYARQRLGLPPVFARALHTATIYRYALTYKDAAPIQNMYIGLFMDPDLGFFSDDYVGSYPESELAFIYNGDDFDEGTRGYGASPPALGVRMISGPAARPLGGFMIPFGSSSFLPSGQEAYQYLRGEWGDGSPLTYGGNGYNTGPETDYLFSDLPPGFWSELDIDAQGTSNIASDRNFLASHGPFRMVPGETVEVAFALVYSRSESGHLASVRQLVLRDAPLVGGLAEEIGPDPELRTITLTDLPTTGPPAPDPEETPARYAVAETVWPNPVTGDAVLRVDLPTEAHVRLAVYDVLGRRLAVPVDETLSAAKHRLAIATAGWRTGTYLYRLAVTPSGQSAITAGGRFLIAR